MLRENILCCFIGRGRLYKVLNAEVPIIVAHVVSLKNNEGFHFRRINFLKLKVGSFSLLQCEIKLIHKMVHFLKPSLLIFTRGANISGGHCMLDIPMSISVSNPKVYVHFCQ